MRGKDPPTKLTPQMIPPSCRNQMPQQQQTTPVVSKVNPLVPAPVAAAAGPIKPGDYSAIKELDTLHGEVEQLGKEKLQLKQELVEKQDAIQQKKSEIDVSVFSYKKENSDNNPRLSIMQASVFHPTNTGLCESMYYIGHLICIH